MQFDQLKRRKFLHAARGRGGVTARGACAAAATRSTIGFPIDKVQISGIGANREHDGNGHVRWFFLFTPCFRMQYSIQIGQLKIESRCPTERRGDGERGQSYPQPLPGFYCADAALGHSREAPRGDAGLRGDGITEQFGAAAGCKTLYRHARGRAVRPRHCDWGNKRCTGRSCHGGSAADVGGAPSRRRRGQGVGRNAGAKLGNGAGERAAPILCSCRPLASTPLRRQRRHCV
jgi:hypothetical protein